MKSFAGHTFLALLDKSRSLALSALAIAALFVALTSAGSAQAALLKSYDFNGNYSDTLGNGVDLIPSGGSIAGGRYGFAMNQGLQLLTALPSTTDYGVEIRFRVDDDVVSFNKLIDFQNLTADAGLYQYQGGVRFYSSGSTVGTVSLNTDHTVGLARSGGSIELFLDGASLGNLADGSNLAVPVGNILNFFEDDNTTSQGESFIGSVDFIRIHDDSSTFGLAPEFAPPSPGLPEPSSLALLSLGVLGLIRSRRRGYLQSK